ncbi:MAG TPA: histone deacetylase [Gemmatimonadota bacterium]|jgi:acetoin utilization deacetylase AcuC-like enzyme|nr:histone deacetylase [Gemmatimonadota bacterium]
MRLGDHVVFSPRAWADIGPHVFPMEKYAGVFRRLEAEDGVREPLRPEPSPRAELLRVHSAAYLDDLDGGVHTWRTAASELPLTAEIADFFRLACGGTTLAARTALERGWAVHLGGGFHHAFAERAEGFCYLNDLAVAARAVQAEGRAARVAVADLDVHQGNGTAGIFRGDPTVYTFSVHQEDNYPVKEPGDRDIGLISFDPARSGSPWVEDAPYLEVLEAAMPEVLDEARPDLVLYQAGADPYRHDQLGGFRLTLKGLERRDEMVFAACRRRGIPVATTFGGGYAVDVEDTIAIHLATVRAAGRVLGEAA